MRKKKKEEVTCVYCRKTFMSYKLTKSQKASYVCRVCAIKRGKELIAPND